MNNNYKMEIVRFEDDSRQTLGDMNIYFEEYRAPILALKTLELCWVNNEKWISCIPAGPYTVKKRWSPKHGWHFEIKDVEGRKWILIHKGNYYTDIEGCVLVGFSHSDINLDGYIDTVESKKAMKALLKILPKKFELEIINDFDREEQSHQLGGM